MRATRAYIASAGTAAVMLGASLLVLAVVSSFIAFGSWPGSNNGKQIDQVLLDEVVGAKPKTVAVRADAVQIARRAELRRQVALARKQRSASRGGGTPGDRTIAKAPSATTPAGTGGGGTVQQPVQTVTNNLGTTTKDVGTQVQQQVDQVGTQVQQVQTQVNQVVDQVVGDVQQQTSTTVQQVQGAVGTTTGTVQDTAGSLLGG